MDLSKQTLCRRSLFSFGLFLGFFISYAQLQAEVKTFTETAKAFIGDNQTKNDARLLATLEAKRLALEKAGTYVASLTIVENSYLKKDEVLAFTAGVTKTNILSEKPIVEGESFGLIIKAEVTLDTSVVAQKIKEYRQDRKFLEQNQALLKRNRELEEELRQIKAELAKFKDRQKVRDLKKKPTDPFIAFSRQVKAMIRGNEDLRQLNHLMV